MNLSFNWLSEFVDMNGIAPHDFAESVTMTGSKVECYNDPAAEINKVVVGKILSIERHPDADKLVVCSVDVGDNTLQIVTGASNLTVGDLVPVALDGSTLPNDIKIKKGKLRGVESYGMLCSLGELNLTVHDFPYAIENGIFVIKEDCKPGDDIKKVLHLSDTIVEFEITPNRPDCLSVIGLAREVAATYDREFKKHTPVVKESDGDIKDYIEVDVQNPKICTRYMARVVKNVKVEPSPLWIRERLRAHGVRPINNIVDITNYVMLEYGQPMHAFDYRFVNGKTIVPRMAKKDETIVTLDGVERKLTEKMAVIANCEKPMAVAGVMGGENSGIMDDTTTVVFESACFNGPSVRNTSRALALRTESSAKYEKGLDAQNCAPALERACELVEMLGAGEVVCGKIDVDNSGYTPTKLTLDADWINRFIGIDVSEEDMRNILRKIDFEVNGNEIIVPSFRGDVEHKADVAEEIARFYSYEKIPTTQIRGSAAAALTPEQKTEKTIYEALISMGYSEIQTFSFISPKFYDKMLISKSSQLRDSVVIKNPLGEDTSIMRTTAVPSMMEVLATNYASRNMAVKMFELASVYIKNGEDKLPNEPKKIVLGAYGGDYDYFDLKGAVEELLRVLNISDYDIAAKTDADGFHPGRCAELSINGESLGIIGEIHPAAVKNYGISSKVYAGQLDFGVLFKNMNTDKEYRGIPRFPASARDLAMICDVETPVISIEKAIKGACGKLCESVSLFDVYTGSQVESGKKSVAYNIVLRASDRTLKDEEVDNVIKKVLKALDKIGVTLRK